MLRYVFWQQATVKQEYPEEKTQEEKKKVQIYRALEWYDVISH